MKIDSFFGPYRFLSNFYPCSKPIICDMGIEYPTVEHAYQAYKSLDKDVRLYISQIPRPGTAKRHAKTILLRDNWNTIRVGIMEDLLRQKFSQFPLKQMLLETEGFDLIEGNDHHDSFWGVYKGKGANNLGKLLMKIRKEYKMNDILELD